MYEQHHSRNVLLQKYGLSAAGWDELATWPFAHFCFNQPSDWFQNCNKLKQTGFHGMLIDTDKVGGFVTGFALPASNAAWPLCKACRLLGMFSHAVT